MKSIIARKETNLRAGAWVLSPVHASVNIPSTRKNSLGFLLGSKSSLSQALRPWTSYTASQRLSASVLSKSRDVTLRSIGKMQTAQAQCLAASPFVTLSCQRSAPGFLLLSMSESFQILSVMR